MDDGVFSPATTAGDGRSDCTETLLNVESVIVCAAKCFNFQNEVYNKGADCKAFYYQEATKKCLVLKFYDRKLGLTSAQGWKKFVNKRYHF